MKTLSELVNAGIDVAIVEGNLPEKFKPTLNICESRDSKGYYQLVLHEIDNVMCVDIVCGAIKQNRQNPHRQRLMIGLAFNATAEDELLCQLFDALLDCGEKVDFIMFGDLEINKCPKLFARCLANLSRFQHLELSFYPFNKSQLQQLMDAFKASNKSISLSLEIITEEDINEKDYEPLRKYFEQHKLLLEVNAETYDYRSTYNVVSSLLASVDDMVDLAPLPLLVDTKQNNNATETEQITIKLVEVKIFNVVESVLLKENKPDLLKEMKKPHENPINYLAQFLEKHPLEGEARETLESVIENGLQELDNRITDLRKCNNAIVMQSNLQKVAETIEKNNHEIKEIKNFYSFCSDLGRQTRLYGITQSKRPLEVSKDPEAKRQKLPIPETVEEDDLQQAIAFSLGRL